MKAAKIKSIRRVRRKQRVRKAVQGHADRPRLTVTRSLKHIQAQVVDDDAGVTLCAADTRSKDLRATVGYGGNVAAARLVGKALAERALARGVQQVCFDRNGYKFHGRVKALADAAREAGLKF